MLKNIPIRVATSAERYCGGEQKWWSQPVSRPPCTPNQQAIANYNKFIANYSKLYPGGPIPHNLARALMPRQPYSVAVLSTGGRLHPRFLRKRGLGRKWSSPCRRDGEVENSAPSCNSSRCNPREGGETQQ